MRNRLLKTSLNDYQRSSSFDEIDFFLGEAIKRGCDDIDYPEEVSDVIIVGIRKKGVLTGFLIQAKARRKEIPALIKTIYPGAAGEDDWSYRYLGAWVLILREGVTLSPAGRS